MKSHDFEMTTLICSSIGTFKGALQMKWRIVDQVNADIRRSVVLAVCDPIDIPK